MPEPCSTPVELLRGLAVMAEAPDTSHEPVARALGFARTPTPSEYADVFLFQLYPYASVHLGPEGMMGGEARDRVAGFWRALGLTPSAEPDHLAALLGLYATLAEREVAVEGPERSLTRRSRGALLEEHLAPWVFAFLSRCAALPSAVYAEWARMLDDVLRAEWSNVVEIEGAGRDTLPLHLREAPGLPDPRVEGAQAFLGGLLAPVRAGMILTRADLARIAGAASVGLRAGERRYALEHLLAQSAAPVLTSLAREAEVQALAHRSREGWLGASARFFTERCEATASVLMELATDPASTRVPDDARPAGATAAAAP